MRTSLCCAGLCRPLKRRLRGGGVLAFFRGLRQEKDKEPPRDRAHSRKIDLALGKWRQLDETALRRRHSEFKAEHSKSNHILGHTSGTVNFHHAYPKVAPLTGDLPSKIILPPQVLRTHAQRTARKTERSSSAENLAKSAARTKCYRLSLSANSVPFAAAADLENMASVATAAGFRSSSISAPKSPPVPMFSSAKKPHGASAPKSPLVPMFSSAKKPHGARSSLKTTSIVPPGNAGAGTYGALSEAQ